MSSTANTSYQLEGNAAELYEKHTMPSGTRPAAERLLEHVTLKPTDRVLDAACGTGIVARLVAQAGTQIASLVGLDLNQSMLDVARSLEPAANFPITWQHGDLCALPNANTAFDVVLCNHGFQFVPDKPAALQEIKRVLSDGGRYAFTVVSAAPPMNVAIADSVRRHIGEELVKSVLAPFSFRDAALIKQLLSDAGFENVSIEDIAFTRRFPAKPSVAMDVIERSAYAKDVAAATETSRTAITEEVYEAMQPYREGDEFAEPVSNFLVQATKAV